MKKIVKYTTSSGKRMIGRLIKDNIKTAIIKPHRWISSPEIKIHKAKQKMEFTGETT